MSIVFGVPGIDVAFSDGVFSVTTQATEVGSSHMAYHRKKSRSRSKDRRRKSRSPTGETKEQILRIEALGRHGDGSGRVEGAAENELCFVPYVLPGELVKARTLGKRGELVEVLEPSKDRVAPQCQYFGKCGGCAAQHMSETTYRDWKTEIVETALRNKGLELSVSEMRDAHGDGRRRVTYHALVHSQNQNVRVGFMQFRSDDLIAIDACPILSPALKNTPELARELAEPFAQSVRQLDIAITETAEGLDCDLRGAEELTYDIHVALAELADKWKLARITLDGVMELERHKPMLPVADVSIPLPPGSFLQATALGEQTLVEHVVNEVGEAKHIADLFCGVGPYALQLARTATVYAADSNEVALAALQSGYSHSVGLKHLEAEVRDLFRNPLYRDDLDAFDAVVLNPARAGAQAQSEELAASEVPLVVYVSCDPATLARDAEILVEGGYDFLRIAPVDQFKYSSHIETVSVFKRP